MAGRPIGFTTILKNAWDDVMNNHTMTLAAGLSYYFVLSLFPLLILAASLLAYLPVPNLFDVIMGTMARVVPPESMGLVRQVVQTVAHPHGGLLTFGLIGTIWTASSGFAGLIEALNVAYDVPETRPIWETRLLAMGLMFIIGILLTAAALLMIIGPKVALWIASAVRARELFLSIWPFVRWGLALAFTVIGVELMYFWAPNVKQRFMATLPGAVIAVAFFMASSYGLAVYFRQFANFNKTYGALGGAIALLVWLYYSWFAILLGAEINSELVKAYGDGRVELKGKPPVAVKAASPWEEHPAA
jgi:membrane protein